MSHVVRSIPTSAPQRDKRPPKMPLEQREATPLRNGWSYRDYQEQCSDVLARHMRLFPTKPRYGVVPTGGGKSMVIARTADITGGALVLQPSEEILRQNYKKALMVRGEDEVGMFSASVGRRQMRPITFATIGSIKDFASRFRTRFPCVIVDECHYVNPEAGRSYTKFLKELGLPVTGVTATAVRLHSDGPERGSRLDMLHRIQPASYFNGLAYVKQIAPLHAEGNLADLVTEQFGTVDRLPLETTTAGADYTKGALQAMSNRVRMAHQVAEAAQYALDQGRKHILCFLPTVADAEAVNKLLGREIATHVHGGLSSGARREAISSFTTGRKAVMANCGVLTTGFDFPELDCVILGRPTLSLALYYQMVGRLLRTHPNKLNGLLIDLVGDTERYGCVLKLRYEQDNFPDENGFTRYGWAIIGEHGDPLTGIKLEAI